jgi:hypothetical protein
MRRKKCLGWGSGFLGGFVGFFEGGGGKGLCVFDGVFVVDLWWWVSLSWFL